MFVLPPGLVDVLPSDALVVEVGIGGRWSTLEALRVRRPDLRLRATDIRQQALREAPDGVETVLDDAFDPDPRLYVGARLLYAVRCPAELQPPLAELARETGAALAIRPLKDEWAEVDRTCGPHAVARGEDGSAWRIWGSSRPPGTAGTPQRPRARGEHA